VYPGVRLFNLGHHCDNHGARIMKKSLLYLWVILTLALVMLLCNQAHCTTNTRPNSIGIPEYVLNPYSYLVALPIDGEILDGRFTNIRFSPYGAPMLFDSSLLFCGDVADRFTGKQGVLAITYETRAHAMYQGVACRELLGVFEIKNPQ
jgi:hypothetical protein